MIEYRIKFVDRDYSIVCNVKYSSVDVNSKYHSYHDFIIEKDILDRLITDVSREHGVRVINQLTPLKTWSSRYYNKDNYEFVVEYLKKPSKIKAKGK